MGCRVWQESTYTCTFEVKRGGIEHAGKALSPRKGIKLGTSKAHRLFASQNFSPRLTNHIITVSKQKKVDPILVYAVMKQESGFRLKAGSHAGAKGLMQVMPFHFPHCGVSNGFNAYQNTTCGIGILADALNDAHGNVKIALSLYNSGKKNGYLRFNETKNYVRNITAHYNKLKGA